MKPQLPNKYLIAEGYNDYLNSQESFENDRRDEGEARDWDYRFLQNSETIYASVQEILEDFPALYQEDAEYHLAEQREFVRLSAGILQAGIKRFEDLVTNIPLKGSLVASKEDHSYYNNTKTVLVNSSFDDVYKSLACKNGVPVFDNQLVHESDSKPGNSRLSVYFANQQLCRNREISDMFFSNAYSIFGENVTRQDFYTFYNYITTRMKGLENQNSFERSLSKSQKDHIVLTSHLDIFSNAAQLPVPKVTIESNYSPRAYKLSDWLLGIKTEVPMKIKKDNGFSTCEPDSNSIVVAFGYRQGRTKAYYFGKVLNEDYFQRNPNFFDTITAEENPIIERAKNTSELDLKVLAAREALRLQLIDETEFVLSPHELK